MTPFSSDKIGSIHDLKSVLYPAVLCGREQGFSTSKVPRCKGYQHWLHTATLRSEQRRDLTAASTELARARSCFKRHAVLGDSCHVSGSVVVSGGGAATGYIFTCGTGFMLHAPEPIPQIQNIFLTKTGLLLILQGRI